MPFVSSLPPYVLPVLALLLFFGLLSFWLYRNVSSDDLCPRCGDYHVDRVPRNWFWRLFGGVRAYQCAYCGKRFIRLS